MKYVFYASRLLLSVLYLAVVIDIMSVAKTKFETVVLAGMALICAIIVFNFLSIRLATHLNEFIGLRRFRRLGMELNISVEGDPYEEWSDVVEERMKRDRVVVHIEGCFNTAVFLYALYKIVEVTFFS